MQPRPSRELASVLVVIAVILLIAIFVLVGIAWVVRSSALEEGVFTPGLIQSYGSITAENRARGGPARVTLRPRILFWTESGQRIEATPIGHSYAKGSEPAAPKWITVRYVRTEPSTFEVTAETGRGLLAEGKIVEARVVGTNAIGASTFDEVVEFVHDGKTNRFVEPRGATYVEVGRRVQVAFDPEYPESHATITGYY